MQDERSKMERKKRESERAERRKAKEDVQRRKELGRAAQDVAARKDQTETRAASRICETNAATPGSN